MKLEYNATNNDKLIRDRHDGLHVSIIVPVHQLSQERTVDPLQVKHAFEQAAEILRQKLTKAKTKAVLEALNELYDKVDFVQQGYVNKQTINEYKYELLIASCIKTQLCQFTSTS